MLDFTIDFLYFMANQKRKIMKLITKLLIVVATVGLCPGLFAQNLDPPGAKDDHVVNLNDESSGSSGTSAQSSSSYHHNFLFLGQECGMYLCEEWKPGSFELEDGTTFQDRMIRYNIYNQQMEYAWQGDTAAIGNPKDLTKLKIEALIVPVCEDHEIHAGKALITLSNQVKKLKEFNGAKADEITLYQPLTVNAERVIFLGLGKREDITSDALRRFAGIV